MKTRKIGNREGKRVTTIERERNRGKNNGD